MNKHTNQPVHQLSDRTNVRSNGQLNPRCRYKTHHHNGYLQLAPTDSSVITARLIDLSIDRSVDSMSVHVAGLAVVETNVRLSCCTQVNVVFIKYPDECCPVICTRHCHCCDAVSASLAGRVWWTCRCYMYKLVEHRYFETFIIAMILASSLALVNRAVSSSGCLTVKNLCCLALAAL